MDDKPLVCVDLDGVLNAFDGWKSPEYFHPLRPGAREFLQALNARGYRVVVLTVRWKPHVERWLAENGLSEYVAEVTNQKPPAHAYIDDRAICFRGDYDLTMDEIGNFKAHWE